MANDNADSLSGSKCADDADDARREQSTTRIPPRQDAMGARVNDHTARREEGVFRPRLEIAQWSQRGFKQRVGWPDQDGRLSPWRHSVRFRSYKAHLGGYRFMRSARGRFQRVIVLDDLEDVLRELARGDYRRYAGGSCDFSSDELSFHPTCAETGAESGRADCQ